MTFTWLSPEALAGTLAADFTAGLLKADAGGLLGCVAGWGGVVAGDVTGV